MYTKSAKKFIGQSVMNIEKIKDFCLVRNIKFKLNEPMSAHTSLRIGGLSDIVIFPAEEDIQDVVRLLTREGIPYLAVGKCTNFLVKDGGIEGAVIFTDRMNKIIDITDEGCITVQSGCPLQKVISLCAELGFHGMEGLTGIPGSVGGAIAGNAGSFGYEIKDVVEQINILTPDADIRKISKKDANFKYRGSNLPAGSIIMSCRFSLKKDDPNTVKKRIREFLNEKRMKQPLNLPSAGCVFKNPDGVSAGKLIDEAGCKGMRVGGVIVSKLHANYFINSDGGTSSDFLKLMEIVINTVNVKFGVLLEPEIKIVGRN